VAEIDADQRTAGALKPSLTDRQNPNLNWADINSCYKLGLPPRAARGFIIVGYFEKLPIDRIRSQVGSDDAEMSLICRVKLKLKCSRRLILKTVQIEIYGKGAGLRSLRWYMI
jgi:hypothetical protein